MLLYIVLMSLMTTNFAEAERVSKSIQSLSKIGYSTSVIHNSPDNKDLQAESSVRINITPQQKNSYSYQKNGNIRTKQINSPSNTRFTQTNFGNDQNLFNVGQSISFGKGGTFIPTAQKTNFHGQLPKPSFENAEVIRGIAKLNEKVVAPRVNLGVSPKDFVMQAFAKQKQLTGTKYTSAPTRVQSHKVNNGKNQVPKFSYTPVQSQNSFKELEDLKPNFQFSEQVENPWKNIAPGLEFGKSTEFADVSSQNFGGTRFSAKFSGGNKRVRSEKPLHFNHQTALENSESFGFRNGVGHFADTSGFSDNAAANSEVHTEKQTYAVHETSSAETYSSGSNTLERSPTFPTQVKFGKGVRPFPIDTTLLRDPVITTNLQETPKDSRVIPIHFDISSIQTAMHGDHLNLQKFSQDHGNHALQLNNFRTLQSPQKQNVFERLPNPQRLGQFPSKPDGPSVFQYQDAEGAQSETGSITYENAQPINKEIYQEPFGPNGYGKPDEPLAYTDDAYKIVSLRPPPIDQNVRY